MGYLDGSEISLNEKPELDPTSYFSRSKQYAFKLQAICDYKLRIRHIHVGFPDSVHDARIFNNSSIGKNPQNFLTEGQRIAADSAYRLTTQIITPFRSTFRMLTDEKRKRFNKRFSSYRLRIKHCFGILKEKGKNFRTLATSKF